MPLNSGQAPGLDNPLESNGSLQCMALSAGIPCRMTISNKTLVKAESKAMPKTRIHHTKCKVKCVMACKGDHKV